MSEWLTEKMLGLQDDLHREIFELRKENLELRNRVPMDISHIRYIRTRSQDSRGKIHEDIQIDPESIKLEDRNVLNPGVNLLTTEN